MSTLKKASCGTMESSDAYMELEPIAAGVQIDLQSVVEHQFGDSIRLAKSVLRDSFDLTETPHTGPVCTSHGYKPPATRRW